MFHQRDLSNSIVKLYPANIVNKLIQFDHPIEIKSDEKGIAIFESGFYKPEENYLLYVEDDRDSLFLYPITPSPITDNYTRLLWHVFTDRGIYKPKEEVIIQGYLRTLYRKAGGNYDRLRIPGDAHKRINFKLVDPLGNVLIEKISYF